MPAKLDVDREQIRLLAVEYGLTVTAEKTGIPLNTLLSWSARYKWLTKAEPLKLPPTVIQPAIGAIKPSDAQQTILAERKAQSRAFLSEYVVEAGREAVGAKDKLSVSTKVRDVATIHEKLWPEQQKGEVGLNLSILSISGDMNIQVGQGSPARLDRCSQCGADAGICGCPGMQAIDAEIVEQ